MRAASLFLAIALSSCALLQPTAIVHLVEVGEEFKLSAGDTTRTMFVIGSGIHFQFDLNGSNRVSISPGYWNYIAEGIEPGWHYADLIGNEVWVRGVPIYFKGGDTVSVDFGNNYLEFNNKPLFEVYQDRNIQYPFAPALSLNCYGCNWSPVLKFDGTQMSYVPPWIAIDAGWHTIEIESPLDNVHLYFRTLFDNYTETQLDLYPVQMN